MPAESPAERRRFAWLLTATFVALTVPRLLAHELWRDEAWLWLVAIGSRSLGEMLAPLARSGQGYLFPLLCYVARQVSTRPQAMQLVHLLLAAGAAFVFARWAPFSRAVRTLFVLGYFPFYEYAVISRHYAAGALLLWLACAAAGSRRPALGLGAALGLLCQTTVYGYILAVAVVCGWLVDRWRRRAELPPLPRGEAAAGLALGLAGAAAGLVQLVPRADTSFAPGWRLAWQPHLAAQALQIPWRALLPLPQPTVPFWNTNLFDRWPHVQAAGGVLLAIAAVALLWRRRPALAAFSVGACGLLAFSYLKLLGSLRHQGHLWLLLLAALWLSGGEPGRAGRRTWREAVLLAVLIVHSAAGLFASWMDLRHPFSNAASAARSIRAGGLDRYALLGYREPPAAPVALALGRPLYAPSRQVFAWYPDWGPRQRDLQAEELRCVARDLARREGGDIVLVLNTEAPPWAELEAAGATSGAILPSEDYHLYLMRRARFAETAAAAKCGGENGP